MRPQYYILKGQTVTPVADVLQWAKWFETANRHVDFTELPSGFTISTVFMGLDHSFGGKPMLFETMVFRPDGEGILQLRCSTWDFAEQQHAKAVRWAGIYKTKHLQK